MTKLNVQYVGFKLGLRVADRLALDYRPGNVLDSTALHMIKNLVNTAGLAQEIGLCAVNNQCYAIGGK